MRVIFADDVAHDPRRFLVGASWIEAQQTHRPKQPSMDRLQPVADVRQRASGDRRKSVDQVALAKGGVERSLDYRGKVRVGHYPSLATDGARFQRFSRLIAQQSAAAEASRPPYPPAPAAF